jgi:putative ABC transport system permease protein
MFKNYLKTAFRNLWKQRLFSLVNVFGLALGLTVTMFILLYVQAELSYDQFHENNARIYRALRQSHIGDTPYLIGVTSAPYGPALANDFPESVKSYLRVMPNNGLVTYENQAFIEDKFFFADRNFFEVFSYPLAAGDPATALAQPNSVVLTPEMAQKYFGESNPLGKTLRLDNRYDFTVTGVMAEKPGRSHLDFDFMASIYIFNNAEWFGDWWNNSLMTYLLIDTPAVAQKLETFFPAFMDKYFAKDFERIGSKTGLTLQPLSAVYFQKDIRYDFAQHGDQNSLYIFSAIAVFILIVACIKNHRLEQ